MGEIATKERKKLIGTVNGKFVSNFYLNYIITIVG